MGVEVEKRTVVRVTDCSGDQLVVEENACCGFRIISGGNVHLTPEDAAALRAALVELVTEGAPDAGQVARVVESLLNSRRTAQS